MINANFDPKAYMDAYSDVRTYCNGSYTKADKEELADALALGLVLYALSEEVNS
ncbi:MAG: hypothetical protein K6E91_00805 [Butyrivibrio sp.]|nr:hypothetical protein [Butyrivibrio sp.]